LQAENVCPTDLIGEPVPDNVILKNVIDSLSQEVFEIDDTKAWKNIAISVAAYSPRLFLTTKTPRYLFFLA
jgi:omega-6 fatty acid desaturase (delta-12 desaturase)